MCSHLHGGTRSVPTPSRTRSVVPRCERRAPVLSLSAGGPRATCLRRSHTVLLYSRAPAQITSLIRLLGTPPN